MSGSELITANQLAEHLQISPRTVQEWARQGRIPTMRLSAKLVRFDLADVLAALRAQAKPEEACA